MLRIEEMQDDITRLRAECAQLQSQAGFLGAWQSLKQLAVWEAVSTDLAKIEKYALETCIANGTSETQWRESAAEARVYRWLRMRPESVEESLKQIAQELKTREAEIKRLESLTKGA